MYTNERDENWMGQFIRFHEMEVPDLINAMNRLGDSELRAAVDALANRARMNAMTTAEYLNVELVTDEEKEHDHA